jgi:hypothetical protein
MGEIGVLNQIILKILKIVLKCIGFFKTQLRRPFFKHQSKARKQKLSGKLAWHCCMCCNPANGRVEENPAS